MTTGSTDPYQQFASFYDIYVGAWLDDLPFYLEYAKGSSSPMLEVGAGSGRLTIPFLESGLSVTAVDASASMLAILRSRLSKNSDEVKRRARVILSDIRTLELGTAFDLIIVPYYTFNYLLKEEDQDTALRRLSRHLSGGGRLLIDVFLPLRLIESCPAEPVLRVDSTDPVNGNRVRGWNTYTMNRQRQLEYRRHAFEVTQPDGNVFRSEFSTVRHYSFPAQLERVFSKAGMRVDCMFSGYKKDEPTATSEQILYILAKSGSERGHA